MTREMIDGETPQFTHLLTQKQGKFTNQRSWKAPAKHVRFDLSNDLDRQKLHDPNFVGWAGGYLYMR